MKTTLTIILTATLTAALIFLLCPGISPFFKKKPEVCMAIVAPLTGMNENEGRAMINGARLYLEQVNSRGGVDGKQVKLLIFDDRNQEKGAREVASEIVGNPKILLVLGHYDSPTSVAAGGIYRKHGIPVITGSAISERVTLGNDWYFRVTPNDRFQGGFIAHYMARTLKKGAASIISETHPYSKGLAKHFETTARHLGVEIRRKWEFDPNNENLSNQLAKIVSELRAMKDPGMIFMATRSGSAAPLISSLKYPGAGYTIIGPESFARDRFIRGFDKYPRERAKPGYYSDDILAVAPFLADIAGEKASEFKHEFRTRYSEEPGVSAACYYDAAMVAVEAVKQAQISGEKSNIQRERKAVRDTLALNNRPDTSVGGITNALWFDKNGDVKTPLGVGFYKKQRLFPAFSQYQADPSSRDVSLEAVLKGDVISFDGLYMNKIDVVFAGVHINQVEYLNMEDSSYLADFYLWFRFRADLGAEGFDDANIRFVNAVGPVRLDAPVADRTSDGVTVRAYHVKSRFQSGFDFHDYPFDRQRLVVRLRHNRLTRDRLIYVTDTLGLETGNLKPEAGNLRLETGNRKPETGNASKIPTGWRIRQEYIYEDILAHRSSPGFSDSQSIIAYSRFNAGIEIERGDMGPVFKSFLPVLVMVIVLYLTYAVPYRQYRIRILIILAVFSGNMLYHLNFLYRFRVEYWTLVEYAFLAVYGLIALAVFISVLIFTFHRRDLTDKMIWIVRAGKIIHPIIALVAGILIIYGV